MKKILLLALVALSVAVVPSLAGAEDASGPGCVDILAGNGGYTSDGTVRVIVDLEAPACKQFTYSLIAETAEGEMELTLVQSIENQLFFEGRVDPATNNSVCVYATSSVGNGHHLFDRAPDEDFLRCVSIPKDGGPNWGGFS